MFFALATAAIIATTIYYKNILRSHIVDIELPLRSQELINTVDKDILEAARALNIPAKAPTLQTWIAHGEPNDEIDSIYKLFENLLMTYDLDTVNFASHQTKQYTLLSRGNDRLDCTHKMSEHDDWYLDFQKRTASGTFDSTFVVYVDDPLWGCQSYINKRVEHNGKFAGILSISVHTRDLSTKLIEHIVGREGVTFCVNSAGIICLDRKFQNIHKHITEVYPAYASIFPKIIGNIYHYDEYQSEFKGTRDTRHTFSEKIPQLDLIVITESSENEFLRNYATSIYVAYTVAGFFALLTLVFLYLYVYASIQYRK